MIQIFFVYRLFSASACLSVCLSVCLSEAYLKNYKMILWNFLGGVGRGRRKNRLDFGGDPNSFVEPGSFSVFFIIMR